MYEISDEHERIIADLIENDKRFRHLDDCKIRCLITDKQKTKSGGVIVYADTEKVKDKYEAITDVDFIITFYPMSEYMTEEQKKILAIHELMHIGWDGMNKSILPHDLEDFRELIREHGVDWAD